MCDSISKYDPSITFASLLLSREGQFFDRKSARIAPKDLAKHVSALANASGGVVAIGIENDGKVTGLEMRENSENEYRKVPVDFLVPTPEYEIEILPYLTEREGYKSIMLFHIRPSLNCVIQQTDGHVYLRVGDSTRKLDADSLRRLEYEKGVRSYEEQIVDGATLNDLDSNLMEEYGRLTGSSSSHVEDLLIARGVIKRKGGRIQITNAGILLFGKTPTAFLPQARVRFLRYSGTTENVGTSMNIVKDITVEKSLHILLQEMQQLLSSQMREFQFLDSNGRFRKVPEYPEFTWLEGLVNAVAHRNYSIRGDYVRVKMFDDRIEFVSPGKLPNIVTVDNIRETRYSRNPIIARVLADFAWVRELNEGVKRMYIEMAEFFLDPPLFSEPGQMVSLVLRNNIAMRSTRKAEVIQRLIQKDRWQVFDDLERTIISLIANIENCSMKNLEAFTGKSRVTIQKRLKNMVPEIIIEHKTSPNDPTKYYTLADS